MTETVQPTKPVRGCPSTTGNERQLNTTTLIRHAARTHGDQEIVYRTPAAAGTATPMPTATHASAAAPMRCALGVEPGDRVGVLDWNSRRHFELYWSIPGLGAVMLQMNLRLGPEDLGYVVGHSDVSYVCVDESLLPIAESVAANSPQIKGWIVMTEKPLDQVKTTLAPLLHYEPAGRRRRQDRLARDRRNLGLQRLLHHRHHGQARACTTRTAASTCIPRAWPPTWA